MKKYFQLFGFASFLCLLLTSVGVKAQTMLPIPTNGFRDYDNVQGFYFTAPTDFLITGLRVSPQAGADTQSIEVIKIHGNIPSPPDSSSNFNKLYYTNTGTNGVIQNVNIPVSTGDVIGIFGQAGKYYFLGMGNPYPSNINGHSVDLKYAYGCCRLKSHELSAFQVFPNYNYIGDIEMYYVTYDYNAGVDSLISPEMTVRFCSGHYPLQVKVSNFGNKDMDSVHLNWQLNGVSQPDRELYFNPALSFGEGAVITLDTLDFTYQTDFDLKVWTSFPDGQSDPFSRDDTLALTITSEKQTPDVRIMPSDTVICEGKSATLMAVNNAGSPSYDWTPNSSNPTYNAIDAGTYSVIVTDTNGCLSSDTAHVQVNPLPHIVGINFTNNGNNNYSFTARGAQHVDTYNWQFGDGNSSTDVSPDHTYSEAGEYTVTLIVSNDCGSDTITKKTTVTGIAALHPSEKQLKLFPNPTKGKVIIQNLSTYTMNRMIIYNALGQKTFQTPLPHAKRYLLNTSGFSTGIYNVRIGFKNDQWVNKKLIIK